MPTLEVSRRTLSHNTFEQLRQLLQQQGKRQGSVVLTESVLDREEIPSDHPWQWFTLVLSEEFKVLLLGGPAEETNSDRQDPIGTLAPPIEGRSPQVEVGLTFEPSQVAQFLTGLEQSSLVNLEHDELERTRNSLQPNNPHLQSEFTLSAIALLTAEDFHPTASYSSDTCVSICQPVENALHHQIEQERLLNQVTTQIRQSLELPTILSTAVEQVRRFLLVDRLAIFQFNPQNQSRIVDSSNGNPSPENLREPFHLWDEIESVSEDLEEKESKNFPQRFLTPEQPELGAITYESRASNEIPSLLSVQNQGGSFMPEAEFQAKYHKGFIQVIADVTTAYTLSPSYLEMLRDNQIQAQLIVPIVVQDNLWGLLIAHQCFETRFWLPSEQDFLKHIAEHLALAIHQAELYAQVHRQKKTLEERVIERTHDLHDALVAAESANRAKSEFLATMSHELRTPLTCVIGMSSTLLRWSFGQMSAKQQEYLKTIHDSGEHLLELINDILDLSQLEAGKAILKITEFSLTKLAHQCLQNVAPKAVEAGLELEMTLALEGQRNDLWTADRRRVQQIILNLLNNAIKFTPNGGTVTLRVWSENKNVIFQVEDTGVGIPEDQQSLLFKNFQQLDTSYRRQYGGTGLGLALTKQLVELHGGWIEVQSTVGEGSIFTVHLPAARLLSNSTSQSRLGDSFSSEPLQGRIILIEDCEESAILICDILTTAGYQVVWMIDGATALEQFELLQPTVVILNYALLGMNGSELIQSLRQSPARENLKILALIGLETGEDKDRAFEAGADDCSPKPIAPERLINQVNALFYSCRALNQPERGEIGASK
ncbi:hybrid sensor histidine kinase/response regulator [Oscillatoria acuminata]|uniref:Circadian input-output histidine kinase CikA n=1 Tax=Oscillatoria acuminata PCC 6304 TaxID=56110 RepID=K9TMZ5_9CYAN|nr:ATP-binding protein [Oscillatoria acuminata]AFY84232.1 signal transduction histidine kinase [Oscillatoria acuminata PCC 6304]